MTDIAIYRKTCLRMFFNSKYKYNSILIPKLLLINN